MNRKPGSIVIALAVSLMVITVLMVSIANAASPRPDGSSFIRSLGPSASGAIRISQVYGGGGNTGSTYKRDFIELFNIGTTSITLNSWSVQYSTAAGSNWSSNITVFTATIEPGQYFLVAEAYGAGGSVDLTQDISGTIIMAATAGKVALVNNSTALSGTCPSSANIQDFIGYGTTANCSETANAPAPSNTNADIRKLNGCQDLDDNSLDFSTTTPNPRNTSSSINICGLSISKSAVGQIAINHIFTYTLVITNATIAATAVVITDLISSNATYVPNSASNGGDLLNGDTVSWTIASLAHASIVSRTFVVTAPTTSGSIVNQLYRVSAGNITSDAFGSAITTTVLAPALGMIKTATPNSNVSYHGLVTYSIVLSNSGLADALNTFVTDTLPSEVDFASWITQSGASQNSDQITWNGTISIGKAITLTFVVTHVGTYGETVTNTAQFDQIGESGSASAAFTVEAAAPALHMSKTAAPNVNVAYHGEVTYTLVVSNDGSADALNTFITDTLPGEVDFDRWIDQSGASQNLNVITWNGTISIGQAITLTFVVSHVGSYADVVTNTAQFYHTSGSGSSSAIFSVVSASPNLTLTKSVSPSVNVGNHAEVTYTLALTNSGATDATNTFVTDTLPISVTFARWIDQAGASENANEITWNGTVTASSTIQFAFVVTHTGTYGDVIMNTAQFDQASGSGSSSATFNVIPATPHLVLTKSVNPSSNVTNHSAVTYTISLTNDGAGEANGVLMTDTLPSALTFSDWIVSPTNTTLATNVITWNGNIAAGSVISWNFTAIISGTGAIVNNTAQIDYSGSITSASVSLTVAPSSNLLINELDAQQTGTDTNEFVELYDGGVGHSPLDGLTLVFFNGGAANDPSYFSIDLDNHQTDANGYFVVGNSAVASAVITFANNTLENGPDAVGLFVGNAIDFPNGTPATNTNVIDAIVYADIASKGDDAVLRSTLLNPNEPLVLEGSNASQAEVKSAQRCPNGSGGYRNTATYLSSVPTPGTANACPSINITKIVTPTINVTYHGNVTYTLLLSNSGVADALSAQLTDTLPSEVDFAKWIARSGASANGDVITWTGSVTANQAITFTFVVTHVGNYGELVTNTAQFGHPTGSGSANAVFTVAPAVPSLSIAKAVKTIHTPVKLGDPITYTIVVTNSGAGNAIGVVISDVLPAGVSGANLNQTINISANQHVSFTIAAVVTSNLMYYGRTITNTSAFSHTSGSGSASAAVAIEPVPPANIGAIKFSTPNNQRVLPNSLVTYTIVLSNSGGVSATVRITDVTNSYYTVFNALNFTQSPTGTLKWSGVVTAGQSIALNFVARVKAVGQLSIGHLILNNAATIDDGSHAPTILNAASPPWVDEYGIYLPLVKKNS